MTEVVNVKFRNRGKAYSFDPSGMELHTGDRVIVDTANGLELATCSYGNHMVEDTAVIQPLRRVLRVATQMDLRTEELNHTREAKAMEICQEKVREHQLDMKLVDVECNFEGNKTTFFFTSDNRVDFRALVKDLAAILHNRIELRQIGVRDEAKLLGGLGICGRPYCCSQFLDDFHPVSTKMAKIQSLSLNPAKISGSCGRLMCCLRYEQEAYEDLVKKVPKQGAFVETKDGYGTAVQVNLLRSTVKVRLDDDRDDSLHEYQSYELAAVPGGRPKDGSAPPHVLEYVEPEPVVEEPSSEWAIPTLLVTPVPEPRHETESTEAEPKKRSRSRRHKKSPVLQGEEAGSATPEPLSSADGESTPSPARKKSRHRKKPVKPAAAAEGGAAAHAEKIEGDRPAHQHHTHTKAPEGAAHGEAHSVTVKPAGAKASHRPRHRSRRPKSPAAPSEE